MSDKLRQAFLEKEKADLYLFNLEKLREEKSIEETYYTVLKTEYTKLRDVANKKIEAIKADIKKVLDSKLKEASVAKLNHKYLEIRYKVGQINANDFLKQEQGPKKKIAELEKSISQLQAVVNANNSAELPGKSTVKKPTMNLNLQEKQTGVTPNPAPAPIPLVRPVAISEVKPQQWKTMEEVVPASETRAPEQTAEESPPQKTEAATPQAAMPQKVIIPGLSITDLEILPDRVVSGNHIGVVARVKNLGQQIIEHTLELRINDETRDTAQINLEPGQMRELTFLVVAGLPGEYRVELEGQEGKFIVV